MFWLGVILAALLLSIGLHLDQKLDRVLGKLDKISAQEARLMAIEDDILAEAQRGTTIGDSIINLVSALVAAETGIPPDVQAKLQTSLDSMRGENDKIAAAVLANTPQAPPAPAPAP